MSLEIHDEETSRLVRALAEKRGIGLTEAVKLAVEHELMREEAAVPLRDRVAAIRKTVLAHQPTGEMADKAFFDSLGGEE